MPNNASACRCVLFEEKNRLVYCGVFLVSSFKVCFSRRPLLYSFVFLLLFFDVEKHRRSRPTKERKIEDVIARDVIRRVCFLVDAQNKGASSSSSSFTKSARAHRFRRHRRHRDRRDERCFRQNVAAIDIIDSFTVVLFLLFLRRF